MTGILPIPPRPSGPGPGAGPADERLPRPGESYVVRAGDTLSGIARKAYGDARLWPLLLDANPSKVTVKADKVSVRVGARLFVPARAPQAPAGHPDASSFALPSLSPGPALNVPSPAHIVVPQVHSGLTETMDKVVGLRQRGGVEDEDLVNHHGYTTNNKVELLVDGTQAFPRIFEAIDGATQSIHVSYYIFQSDELGQQMMDKLIAAKRRGVDVRVEIDGIGSMLQGKVAPDLQGAQGAQGLEGAHIEPPQSGGTLVAERLEAAGIPVVRNHVFDLTRSETFNAPDHRKLVLVDGKVGFTGGMNVANHYMDEYHDLMIRVEGDAVKQMEAEWALSWMHLEGEPLGAGLDDAAFKEQLFPTLPASQAPGNTAVKVSQAIPGQNAEIFRTYVDRIRNAQKSIHIENPYCTNPEIQDALIAAARRGVEIHVVLPGQSDHAFSHLAARQRYPEMMEAGVHIYEYPGFNHGKVMVTDGRFLTIGSSNLDDVALFRVHELNLDVESETQAQDALTRIFEKDIAISKELKPEDISQFDRMTGKFWNLFVRFI